jgi:hypothetical protein
MPINQEQNSEVFEASNLVEKTWSRGCDCTLRSAMSELLKAFHYANQAQRDTWEFAVEIRRLSSLGLIATALWPARWGVW